jgi:type I restriction enzyme M protein
MPDVQLLPKWVMVRYLMLWKEFEDRKFDSADAWEVLRKLPKPDNRKTVALFLSELRKAGWLQVEFDPDDTRRRIYKLRPYENMFDIVINEKMRGKRQ